MSHWDILTRGADHDMPNTSAYKCMLPGNPGSTLRQIGGGLVYGPYLLFPLVDELDLLPPFCACLGLLDMVAGGFLSAVVAELPPSSMIEFAIPLSWLLIPSRLEGRTASVLWTYRTRDFQVPSSTPRDSSPRLCAACRAVLCCCETFWLHSCNPLVVC